MPPIYSITYTNILPNESTIPNIDTGVGITNHIPWVDIVEELIKYPDFRGWKVELLGNLPKREAKRKNKRKYKDGRVVDIVHGEWKSDGYGRWATTGFMAKLNSIKLLYEIEYCSEPIRGVRNIVATGYTSSHSIARGIERILKLPWSPYSKFSECKVRPSRNDTELREYQKKDGGCVRLFKTDRNGKIVDDGWTTKGLFAACKVAASLIRHSKSEQAAYLRYLQLVPKKTREDAREDEGGVEV